jgi:asparagine synthase (glutamine-hydrolysing)
MADASILPTYFLSKMTKRTVTVALSGDGGDELFGGYPTYFAHRLADKWNMIPLAVRQKVIEPIVRSLPVSLNNLSFDYKAKRFIAGASEPAFVRHLRWMGSIPLPEHRHLLSADIMRATAHGEGLEAALAANEISMFSDLDRFALSSNKDVADAIMRLDLGAYLPEDLLVKSDRASMAASLEVRIPFLAYPMVEFALGLPSSLKLRGKTSKYLPKKAFSKLLPQSILQRPKKGFGIPVAKWINADFRPIVDELLDEQYLLRQGIFNPNYVKALVRQHREGIADRRKELWTLLMFQRWWQKFLSPAHEPLHVVSR